MFMSVCAFSIMDLIVKWSDSYPLGQVLFFRGFFGLVFYFFIIPRDRLKNFYYAKRAGLHFLRCLFGLIALISIFIALRKIIMTPIGATTRAKNFHIAYVAGETSDNSNRLLDFVINQLAKIVNSSPLIGNRILLAK